MNLRRVMCKKMALTLFGTIGQVRLFRFQTVSIRTGRLLGIRGEGEKFEK